MVMFSSALAIALPGQPRKAPETSGETPLRPQGGQAIRRSWGFDPVAVPNCSKPACQHAWICRDKRQILRPRHQSHRSTSPTECHHGTTQTGYARSNIDNNKKENGYAQLVSAEKG